MATEDPLDEDSRLLAQYLLRMYRIAGIISVVAAMFLFLCIFLFAFVFAEAFDMGWGIFIFIEVVLFTLAGGIFFLICSRLEPERLLRLERLLRGTILLEYQKQKWISKQREKKRKQEATQQAE